MYALRIENTSETDPRSYKATKAVAKKAQKEFLGFKGIRSYDLRNTGVCFLFCFVLICYYFYLFFIFPPRVHNLKKTNRN